MKVKNFLLKIFFFFLTVSVLYGELPNDFSFRVFLSSSVIIFISINQIFSKTYQPYSLEKMFYIFSFFFFGVAPLLQYSAGDSFFGGRTLSEMEYFYMNILIILILIVYVIFYKFFSKFKVNRKLSNLYLKLFLPQRLRFSQKFLLLALSLISFWAVLYANQYSISSLLIRSGEFKESNLDSKSFQLIIFRFFQPLSMVCLLFYLSGKYKSRLFVFILFLLALITCFPTGMARFSAAALYLPLILLLFKSFEKPNIFTIFFIFSILIIFPFLNNFRYFKSFNKVEFGLDFGMFHEGHFDSYHNFALIVNENIITYGNQLLGVFFFWLPRSLWSNKPIGSGEYLAEVLNFSYTNVSANFFAEGFINFGFIGVIAFLILLTYFSSQIDKLIWSSNDNIFPANFLRIIYFISLGMSFFMLRGDLMSSFAYTVGFVCSTIFVFKVVNFKFL